MLSVFCTLVLFSPNFAGVLSFDRVFTAIAYGAIAIGETLVWTPEYSKAKVGAAHLFALLKKKPTIDGCSQSGEKLKCMFGINPSMSLQLSAPGQQVMYEPSFGNVHFTK
ncbi:ATP-binding cassette sub-family B member 5 [Lemmus lemmus]